MLAIRELHSVGLQADLDRRGSGLLRGAWAAKAALGAGTQQRCKEDAFGCGAAAVVGNNKREGRTALSARILIGHLEAVEADFRRNESLVCPPAGISKLSLRDVAIL